MHHKTLVVTPIHVHPESRLVDWGTIIINNSPSRSQLIGLKPLGEGTAQIESFFSYLLRLADAHAVRLVDLLIVAKVIA